MENNLKFENNDLKSKVKQEFLIIRGDYFEINVQNDSFIIGLLQFYGVCGYIW